jgi:hypothetical protein
MPFDEQLAIISLYVWEQCLEDLFAIICADPICVACGNCSWLLMGSGSGV